jgi:hypothetical protein
MEAKQRFKPYQFDNKTIFWLNILYFWLWYKRQMNYFVAVIVNFVMFWYYVPPTDSIETDSVVTNPVAMKIWLRVQKICKLKKQFNLSELEFTVFPILFWQYCLFNYFPIVFGIVLILVFLWQKFQQTKMFGCANIHFVVVNAWCEKREKCLRRVDKVKAKPDWKNLVKYPRRCLRNETWWGFSHFATNAFHRNRWPKSKLFK